MKASSILMLIACLLISGIASGCGSHRSTTRSETTVSAADTDADVVPADEVDEVVADSDTMTTTETTQTTTEHRGDGGVLGGAFHVIGEILAFPFRVIGGLFDFIF